MTTANIPILSAPKKIKAKKKSTSQPVEKDREVQKGLKPEMRKGMGKGLRFSIFARDNFTCRYCGRQSDVVVLEVDHVIPICQGGGNEEANLITACFDCNRGKKGKLISQHMPTETDRLRLSQELGEQSRIAKAAVEASLAKKELLQSITNYWCEARGTSEIRRDHLNGLLGLISQHGPELVFSWIDIACNRKGVYSKDVDCVKYIFGIRRNVMTREEDTF